MSAPSEPLSQSRRVAHILFGVLLVSALTAAYELRTYQRHVIYLDRLDPAWSDLALGYLSLWARLLIWLTVPTLVAVGLALRGRQRLAVGLGVGASILSALWFIVDARLMRLTGAHIHTYLGFALQDGGREWGGDMRPVLVPLMRTALGRLLVVASVWAALFWLARLPGGRRLAPRRPGLVASLFIAVPVLLLVGRGHLREPALLERLYEVMPARTVLNHPTRIPGVGTTGFGVSANEAFDRAAQLLGARAAGLRDVELQYRAGAEAKPAHRPHVVLFVLESFRHDALERTHMPRLTSWAAEGLVLEQHHAGSNRSDLGTYALLHGRWPIEYDNRAQSASRPTPALLRLFRGAGYATTLIASCPFTWQQMDTYFAAPPFDAQILHTGDRSWPERDRQSVAAARRTLAEADGAPQLIVVFLMSTHWSYEFPVAYGAGQDLAPMAQWSDRDRVTAASMRARYDASLRFLDDELGAFVRSVSADEHLIVITGDHGESFGEDGVRAHATKLSNAQTRTPFVAVGPGIEPARRQAPSLHLDLLPTLAEWLHAGDLHLEGVDGLSLLSARGARDILLCAPIEQVWHVAVVRGAQRLMLRFRTDPLLGPRLSIAGFADAQAFITPDLAQAPATIPEWTASLEALLGSDRRR